MKINMDTTKQEVAETFAKTLNSLIKGNDKTRIALSGGSTPKVVFDYLATQYKDQIMWENVYFYWGDERCVAPDDMESNYKMTVDHLISKINIPEENIYRIKGENKPEEEAIAYGETLSYTLPEVHGSPQFDLVILGMGDDGHTASIFPHEIHLWESEANCEVAVHPDSGQRRITLTGKVINNAKHIAFLVTGEGKAPKVREVIRSEGNYLDYPASLVATENLEWFLDHAAAKELT